MNEKKFAFGKTQNVADVLRSAAYDFYVNGIKIEFADYYSSEDLVKFFETLINISEDHNHELYKKAMKDAFIKKDIEYSEDEVFLHFLFHKSSFFKNDNVKGKIGELISNDYSIIKYSIKEMVMAICHTKDGLIIKNLLKQIFYKSRSGETDIFDETIIISYLVNRNFQHRDLADNLATLNEGVAKFIEDNCKHSFFANFEKELAYNNLYYKNGNKYKLLIEDEILWFQFFMFNYSEKTGKELESYSFLKVFFDRFVAHVMNCLGIETRERKNKPNIRMYYQEGAIVKGLTSIGIETINGKSISYAIQQAHKLRNESPLTHSSSEILKHSNVRFDDLLESKNDLCKIIDLCLEIANSNYK